MNMLVNKDIYERLKQLVQFFSNGSVTRFAQEIGQKHNTFIGYLKPEGQEKLRILTIYSILDRFPEINPAWLLTGDGEMLGSGIPPSSTLPADELNEKLTPAQREMLTYKRTLQELGASPERIIDGIEAIAMGKTCQPKSTYATAESPANPGYNNIHEPGAEFGKDI